MSVTQAQRTDASQFFYTSNTDCDTFTKATAKQ